LPWLPEGLPVLAATTGRLHVQREGAYLRRLVDMRVATVDGVPVLDTADPYVVNEIVRDPGRILCDAEECLGLEHDPGRLRQWLAYARLSTLTGQGKARLAARLRRYLVASERPDRPRSR